MNFFFFQAEDGIRDKLVTGVQTCALPISVARTAATLFAASPRPLRFCYAASVFRQRPRSHAEWRRQERQLGCELIGAGGSDADLEVLTVAAEGLERLGLGRSYLRTHNSICRF